MQQLSLLEYQLPPELLIEPEPKPEPPKLAIHQLPIDERLEVKIEVFQIIVSSLAQAIRKQHLIVHLQKQLRFYQETQIRFFNAAHEATLEGNTNPAMQRMRRHEINRLQNLCDELKSRLEVLTSGCSS